MSYSGFTEWLCRDILGYTGQYNALHGYIGPCSVLGCTGLYKALLGYTGLYIYIRLYWGVQGYECLDILSYSVV